MARGSDPAVLRAAYADGSKFADRVALYRYQRPPVRFPDWALAHVEWRDHDRVLDVGCGPGLYVHRLRQRGTHVIAVDQSAGMVREAGGGVVGDAQALPFASACADVVLAMHFLYHVADIDAAVAELARVIRPGGTVLVATNGPGHHGRMREILAVAAEVPRLGVPGRRFDLANGRGYLDAHFSSIERDAVRSRVVVDAADPIVAFVDSCEEFYGPVVPVEWPTVLARVRAAVEAEIAERGTFEMDTEAGVFVCRAG